MKKGFLFALIMLFAFSFVACTETTTEATTTAATTTAATTTEATTEDTVAPVLTGVEDITIYIDAVFDPYEGISATDDVDGDLTDSITYVGLYDVTTAGRYFLKYSVTDSAGNKTEASRYVTVEVDPSLIGDEMVQNGDFSLGWAIWSVTQGLEGGTVDYEVVDGVLEFNVTGVSGGLWEPRLESNDMTFEQGKTYEVSFDAKADAARSVHVQIGQLLSSAPWFDDFKEGQTEIFDLSTEWQTFTFKFTMTEDTNEAGKVLFENGTVVGGVGTDNLVTKIYYDNIVIVEATPDPDTAGPMIYGIDDVTIETGTAFDPLEGVTVNDLREGPIDISEVTVNGEVDVTTHGEYTLTYLVFDSIGNLTVKHRVVTVVALIFNATDMVVNGDFEAALSDPAEWTLYEANWDGGPGTDGTLSIVEGALKLEVVSIGSWGFQGWLLQAMQEVDFVQGQTYKVTFDAKADAARDISVAAGFSDAENGWHGVSSAVTLGTDYATYEFIFTVTEDNGEFVENLKFEFGQAGDAVYIDNVVLSVLDQPAGVMNPGFDMTGWSTWAQNWGAVGGISTEIVNGELVVDVTAIGESNWSVQLFQEGIALVPGTEYTITFDAKSSVARDINLVLITDVENRETFSLTTEMTTYTFTFTYNGSATTGKIDFEFGVIGTAPVPAVITLDNIAMDNDAAVVNGTFDTYAWNMWAQDWDEGAGVAVAGMEVVNGELVVTVDALGSYNWSIQLFQENIPLVVGATYTIVFDAKADAARDINFKLITDVEDLYVASLTTEMQTFSYTFVYSGSLELGKVDFELGVIGTATAGVVTFDNILLFRNFNPQE